MDVLEELGAVFGWKEIDQQGFFESVKDFNLNFQTKQKVKFKEALQTMEDLDKAKTARVLQTIKKDWKHGEQKAVRKAFQIPPTSWESVRAEFKGEEA